MPLAAFQQNWLLWMTPEWGSKSDPKIGFADRASPVLELNLVVRLFLFAHFVFLAACLKDCPKGLHMACSD